MEIVGLSWLMRFGTVLVHWQTWVVVPIFFKKDDHKVSFWQGSGVKWYQLIVKPQSQEVMSWP